MALVVAAGLLDVVWQWQDAYDGVVPDQLQQVPDQAEPLAQEGLWCGFHAAGHVVGSCKRLKSGDWHPKLIAPHVNGI